MNNILNKMIMILSSIVANKHQLLFTLILDGLRAWSECIVHGDEKMPFSQAYDTYYIDVPWVNNAVRRALAVLLPVLV